MESIDITLSFKEPDGSSYSTQIRLIIQKNEIKQLEYCGVTNYISHAELVALKKLITEIKGLKYINYPDSKEKFESLYIENRTDKKIKEIGEILFGDAWKKTFALRLGVDQRRLLHYLRLSRVPPQEFWERVAILIDEQQKAVEAAKALLPQHAKH